MQKTHGTLDNGTVGSSHGTVPFDVKFLLDGTVIEELGAKTAEVTIFSDFLKYWEILGFFCSCTVF